MNSRANQTNRRKKSRKPTIGDLPPDRPGSDREAALRAGGARAQVIGDTLRNWKGPAPAGAAGRGRGPGLYG